jgi:hypothetical protein
MGQLGIDDRPGALGHICSECHNLSACMGTAIGSSGKEESSFTPVGEKTQSLAGSDEFPFNGSVCRLHL